VSVHVVAHRYAAALLELGQEQGNLDALVRDVSALGETWNASAELRQVADNPLVSQEAKKASIAEIASRLGVGAAAKNLALLLSDRRRLAALPHIAGRLQVLADERRGVVRAEVTTAAPLGEAYFARLQAALERLTGKRVVVEQRQDASLIGGVVARVGDRVYDGSVRSRLRSVREALLPRA
jgi:F-type H+-transporting ATPase subunit delta